MNSSHEILQVNSFLRFHSCFPPVPTSISIHPLIHLFSRSCKHAHNSCSALSDAIKITYNLYFLALFSSSNVVDPSPVGGSTFGVQRNARVLHGSASHVSQLLDAGRRPHDPWKSQVPSRKHRGLPTLQDAHEADHQQHPGTRLRHVQVRG